MGWGMKRPVPEPVLSAMADLRAAFGELHTMHECTSGCPVGCDQDSMSTTAYSYHDECNADAREDIENNARALLAVLDEWVGADRDRGDRGDRG